MDAGMPRIWAAEDHWMRQRRGGARTNSDPVSFALDKHQPPFSMMGE
jgi:hypothetical protein